MAFLETPQSQGPSVSVTDVADELCSTLVEQYSTDSSAKTRSKLKTFLPLSSPAIRSMCLGKIAICDDDKVQGVQHLNAWIDDTCGRFNIAPSGSEFAKIMTQIRWLDDKEELKGVRDIIHGQLLARFEQKWPHSGAALTLAFIVRQPTELSDAVEILQSVLRTDAHFWPARLQLAEAYMANDRWGDAAKQYRMVDDENSLSFDSELDFLLWAECAARAHEYEMAENAISKFLAIERDDSDATNMLANCYLRNGRINDAIRLWLTIIPSSTKRQSWLWVTKSEFYFDESGAECDELNPFRLGGELDWSCNEDTKEGDFILLYRTRPKMDIAYLFVATSDAEESADEAWPYMCECRSLLQFDYPITLEAMRHSVELTSWSALKRQFQGSSFKIDPPIFRELLRLAAVNQPGVLTVSDAFANLL